MTMAYIKQQDLGKAICEAVGIDWGRVPIIEARINTPGSSMENVEIVIRIMPTPDTIEDIGKRLAAAGRPPV